MTRWRVGVFVRALQRHVRDELGDVLQELSGNLTEDGE
jgi:hypothetical protein